MWLRRNTLVAAPLAFLAVFWAYPLYLVLLRATSGLALAVEPAYVWKVVQFTAWQALLSTLAAVVLGLPTAYLLAHFNFPLKAWLQRLNLLPFILPPVVVASSLQALWGQRGWLGWLLQWMGGQAQPLGGLGAIVLAHTFYNAVIICQLVSEFWRRLPVQLHHSSSSLGASAGQTAWRITFPLLLPAILESSLLVFTFCWGAFGTVVLLGDVQMRTIEVEIYHQLLGYGDIARASFWAMLQLLTSGLLLGVAAYGSRRTNAVLPINRQPALRSLHGGWQHLVAALWLLLWSVLLFAPLLALISRSFSQMAAGQWQGWTLQHYLSLWQNTQGRAFFSSPLQSAWHSLQTALVTTILAVGLGLITVAWLVEYKKSNTWLEGAVLLPLSTSAVTLGLGLFLAYPALRSSPYLLPIAHTLVAFPFVVRALLPAWRSLRPQWRQAATMLGASEWQTMRTVTLPLLSPAIINAMRFAFCISLGEFGATTLLSRPEFITLPTAIYQALGMPGGQHYGQAFALSTLLMLTCLLGIGIPLGEDAPPVG